MKTILKLKVKIKLIILCYCLGSFISLYANNPLTYKVPPCDGDAIGLINSILDSISKLDGASSVMEFSSGEYHLSRKASIPAVYHISNTASEKENPDPEKHIGILIKNIRNLKIKGNGAKFVTHGVMTPFVIDSCENITLENFTLDSEDPTVTEIKILEVTDTSFTFETLPKTKFEIIDGIFQFVVDGWTFGNPNSGRRAVAQVYYPEINVTNRCAMSPLRNYKTATQLAPNIVRLDFDKVPSVDKGAIYQFRDWIRNEVCGFVNLSKDILFKDRKFRYMGNFGLISQYTENITIDNIECAPDETIGRTNAGFADFLHFSGCKGKLKIYNSRFCGAQDDGINIHGTHLKIIDQKADNKFTVRFMHPQTFGFAPFFNGDEIEIVNSESLNSVHSAKVTGVEKLNDYDFCIEIDSPFQINSMEGNFVVENITYTPEVEIRGNLFERIPTRGILLTTRKKSLIENNTFFRMPMAAILIADDANSWYESGPVADLTIKGNTFIECSLPNIRIEPEIKNFLKPVHSGIKILDNTFYIDSEDVISVKGAENVIIKDNKFYISGNFNLENIVRVENSINCSIDGNQLKLSQDVPSPYIFYKKKEYDY